MAKTKRNDWKERECCDVCGEYNVHCTCEPEDKGPMTNVEFLTDVMEFSKAGPLMQVFILDALAKWADIVAETPIEELREQFKSMPFGPSADAWQRTANELKQRLAERGL